MPPRKTVPKRFPVDPRLVIEGRLREIQEEVRKLEAARAALVGRARSRKRTMGVQLPQASGARKAYSKKYAAPPVIRIEPKGARHGVRISTPASGAKAGGSADSTRYLRRKTGIHQGDAIVLRGRRADQARAIVDAQPGITPREIAEQLSIDPSYVYRIMPQLLERGEVVREGRRYYSVRAAGGKNKRIETRASAPPPGYPVGPPPPRRPRQK
jgi:hypothetical protein